MSNNLVYHSKRTVDELPEVEKETIQLRDEITTYISGRLVQKLAKVPDDFLKELDKIRLQTTEVSEMIDVNLVSAADVIREKEEDSARKKSIELTREVLDRTTERLEKLSEATQKAFQELESKITSISNEALTYLYKLASTGDYASLKWKSHQQIVQDRAIDWKNKIRMVFFKSQDKGLLLFRFLGKKTHNFISRTDE